MTDIITDMLDIHSTLEDAELEMAILARTRTIVHKRLEGAGIVLSDLSREWLIGALQPRAVCTARFNGGPGVLESCARLTEADMTSRIRRHLEGGLI